ncbi:MAG TPA: Rrf2 family transcriptional regulator [Planctomycetota bacterium]|nr:Rrf2 family transcriptional regulator [Planctomycetota bacterium]
MRLKLQTDFALRVLLYLGYAGTPAPAEAMARAFGISREHLVKVVQELARAGFVRTRPGRGGGVELLPAGRAARVADVVARFEGRQQVLPCVLQPDTCVLEPGCDLRRLLMSAESAFYDALSGTTVADLCTPRAARGGLRHLKLPART